jgi:hypothetical protein
MNHNPYAAPSADLTKDGTGAEWADVALRQAHLQHEVQLKSVGSLYLLAALVWSITSAVGIPIYFDLHQSEPAWLRVITVALLLLVILVLLAVGVGFRGLQSWVRIPGAALSIGGLFLFPLGTLINAYVLYLMFCAKGRTVLAPDYARVRAATPHLRYRRSALERGVIAVLLMAVLAVILWLAFFGAR